MNVKTLLWRKLVVYQTIYGAGELDHFLGALGFLPETVSFRDERWAIPKHTQQITPWIINMKPKNGGLVQMMFLSNWLIFRCTILIFQGVQDSQPRFSLYPHPKMSPMPPEIYGKSFPIESFPSQTLNGTGLFTYKNG